MRDIEARTAALIAATAALDAAPAPAPAPLQPTATKTAPATATALPALLAGATPAPLSRAAGSTPATRATTPLTGLAAPVVASGALRAPGTQAAFALGAKDKAGSSSPTTHAAAANQNTLGVDTPTATAVARPIVAAPRRFRLKERQTEAKSASPGPATPPAVATPPGTITPPPIPAKRPRPSEASSPAPLDWDGLFKSLGHMASGIGLFANQHAAWQAAEDAPNVDLIIAQAVAADVLLSRHDVGPSMPSQDVLAGDEVLRLCHAFRRDLRGLGREWRGVAPP
jgi:hypothetical protein